MTHRRIDIDPIFCNTILFILFAVIVVVLHLVQSGQSEAAADKLINQASKDAQNIINAINSLTLAVKDAIDAINNITINFPPF